MFARRFTVLLAALALVAAFPASAHAAGDWKWPVAGDVVLAYGRTYTSSQGKACTHGGIDIGAAAGTTVRACCGGQVTFAGRVPAGDGAQAFAVTVLTGDGLHVTYLPLRSASVSKGDSVSASGALGVLDGSGDGSSPDSHLHLGVSRGDTKLDPASFLAAPESAPPAPDPTPAPSAPAASKSSAPAASASHASAPSHAAQPSASTAPVHASAPVAHLAPAPATTVRDALGNAVPASSVQAAVPALTRVRQVADPTVLDVDRMVADIRASEGAITSWLLRAALVALAVGCVVPVLKSARAAGAAKAAQPAVARRTVR